MKALDNDDLCTNDCYKYAAYRNILYRKGKAVELLVSYEPAFAMMNEWYKQLFWRERGRGTRRGFSGVRVVFSTDLAFDGSVYPGGSRMFF